jgi:hypothetical protein
LHELHNAWHVRPLGCRTRTYQYQFLRFILLVLTCDKTQLNKGPPVKSPFNNVPPDFRLKLPFLVAGFMSFLFSVYLYFVLGEESAGIFVGLWVPSIHSLGTLIIAPARELAAVTERDKVSS